MNGSNYVFKIRHVLKCKAEWSTEPSHYGMFKLSLKFGQWKHTKSQSYSQHLSSLVCDTHSKAIDPGSMGKMTAACWRYWLPWALFAGYAAESAVLRKTHALGEGFGTKALQSIPKLDKSSDQSINYYFFKTSVFSVFSHCNLSTIFQLPSSYIGLHS